MKLFLRIKSGDDYYWTDGHPVKFGKTHPSTISHMIGIEDEIRAVDVKAQVVYVEVHSDDANYCVNPTD